MVSTRSGTKKEITAQVAAIDRACAARSTKQTAITEFFVKVVARSTVVTEDGTSNNGTVMESAVSVTTSNSSLTTASGSVDSSKSDVALQINLHNHQFTSSTSPEENAQVLSVKANGKSPSTPRKPLNARGKKRQPVEKASSSTVVKKLKVSETKGTKVKTEDVDEEFLPEQTEPTVNQQPQSERRVLRLRPRRGKDQKTATEGSNVGQSYPAKIVLLSLPPAKLKAIVDAADRQAEKDAQGTKKGAKALKSAQVTTKRKQGFRRPRGMPYTNNYQFAFGEDRLPNHLEPTAASIQEVAKIMELERMDMVKSGKVAPGAATPFHAGKGISAESLVRVILSQVCTNEAALDIQATMRQAYPYWVNGQKFIGNFPNYHSMRVQSVEKLRQVIQVGGFAFKAKSIKDCLDIIYAKNVARIPPGTIEHAGNEPFATDFVPGLLSMDYLWDIHQQGGKQAVFDSLVQLPQVGVKSASCLMAFNMGLPVFAVDTHVESMAKLLG
ncbi:hypothetical protein PV08_06254 [Exophiala spinifera]|uniref:HhH-GPD domain-containing protein n=1 Tax=Exophiala spinifera TaxID=91928 RepID=A0A0D2BB21_9EURO|nr:uncharacterized protein PV08_06254 [Exophiala spinifera]KIW16203.1 hypothetical protein PV08_06254 [Exophiala spinifera]